MKNDINYYMSEVEVPPEVEAILLRYDMECRLDLAKRLIASITDLDDGYEGDFAYNPVSMRGDRVCGLDEDRWLSQQSRDTWVRVLRWLAMEAI